MNLQMCQWVINPGIQPTRKWSFFELLKNLFIPGRRVFGPLSFIFKRVQVVFILQKREESDKKWFDIEINAMSKFYFTLEFQALMQSSYLHYCKGCWKNESLQEMLKNEFNMVMAKLKMHICLMLRVQWNYPCVMSGMQMYMFNVRNAMKLLMFNDRDAKGRSTTTMCA